MAKVTHQKFSGCIQGNEQDEGRTGCLQFASFCVKKGSRNTHIYIYTYLYNKALGTQGPTGRYAGGSARACPVIVFSKLTQVLTYSKYTS